MKIQVLFCLVLAFSLAMVKADEYEQSFEDSYPETKLEQSDMVNNDEKKIEETAENLKSDEQTDKAPAPKKVVEDAASETSALVESDESKHISRGYCHFGIAAWFKPGYQLRCGCLKCTCARRNKWDCKFHFPYCPYYYCGNRIYNPRTQICCCGRVYSQRRHFKCCGLFYYNTKAAKCCDYFTVKPLKANCPRNKV